MTKYEALQAVEDMTDFVDNIMPECFGIASDWGMKLTHDDISRFSSALYIAHKLIMSSGANSFHVLGELDGEEERE